MSAFQAEEEGSIPLTRSKKDPAAQGLFCLPPLCTRRNRNREGVGGVVWFWNFWKI